MHWNYHIHIENKNKNENEGTNEQNTISKWTGKSVKFQNVITKLNFSNFCTGMLFSIVNEGINFAAVNRQPRTSFINIYWHMECLNRTVHQKLCDCIRQGEKCGFILHQIWYLLYAAETHYISIWWKLGKWSRETLEGALWENIKYELKMNTKIVRYMSVFIRKFDRIYCSEHMRIFHNTNMEWNVYLKISALHLKYNWSC